MPLDHYVPQTHLRHFYSPALEGKKMFGIRKRDLHIFPCSAKDVCREMDGSTNPFLVNERAIEGFLAHIEPLYNPSVECLRRGGPLDDQTIFALAGMTAYLSSCTPASARVRSDFLKASVEVTIGILEKRGDIKPFTNEINGTRMLSDMVAMGGVNVDIDKKYPKSLGIRSIIDLTYRFGNFEWEIIRNEHYDSPFFTSDNPVAIEVGKDPRIINKIIPLAPDVCLRVLPRIEGDRRVRRDFRDIKYRYLRAPREMVRRINTAIVQCAEVLVFSQVDAAWVKTFVKRHADARIMPVTLKIPQPQGGTAIVHTCRISLDGSNLTGLDRSGSKRIQRSPTVN